MIIKGKSAIRTAHYSWKFPRNHLCKKKGEPWLVWISWLVIALQTERLTVWFPVRAHAWVTGWVTGQVPRWGAYERQPINVSLPFFLPPFPSKFKKKKKKRKKSVPYLSGELSPRLLFWPLPQSTCSSGRPNAELQMLAHPSFPPMLSKELMTF